MIRLILWLALIGAFVWAGSTVMLGKRTLFGHVRAIWHTEEMQELKDGVKETAGPTVQRVKRGVEAGLKAVSGSAVGSGSGSATP